MSHTSELAVSDVTATSSSDVETPSSSLTQKEDVDLCSLDWLQGLDATTACSLPGPLDQPEQPPPQPTPPKATAHVARSAHCPFTDAPCLAFQVVTLCKLISGRELASLMGWRPTALQEILTKYSCFLSLDSITNTSAVRAKPDACWTITPMAVVLSNLFDAHLGHIHICKPRAIEQLLLRLSTLDPSVPAVTTPTAPPPEQVSPSSSGNRHRKPSTAPMIHGRRKRTNDTSASATDGGSMKQTCRQDVQVWSP